MKGISTFALVLPYLIVPTVAAQVQGQTGPARPTVPSELGYMPGVAPDGANGVQIAGMVHSKGPKVDVTNNSFGADPTGVADSTSAFNAAIAYSAGFATKNLPVVYIPTGTYKLTNQLRLNCSVTVEGDSSSATALSFSGAADTRGAIFVEGWSDGGQLQRGYTCNGGLTKIHIDAPDGHLFTATMLEVANATGYKVEDILVTGGGGRGVNIIGDTERLKWRNIEIDNVRYPLLSAGNENDFQGVQINSPGCAGDGYCYGANSANGVGITTGWNVSQSAASIMGSGSTLTVVVNGGTDSGSTNGISPLAPGHHFQLSDITGGLTQANGYWTVDAVANHTPTSRQYTVTAMTGVSTADASVTTFSGTGTATGSPAFKVAILPTHNPAVYLAGVRSTIALGSIKSIANSAGIAYNGGGGLIDSLYIENYFYSTSPVRPPLTNASLEVPGYIPPTTLTAALPASASSVDTTVADTSWMTLHVNNLGDASSLSIEEMQRIEPQDFLVGSTAPSAYVPHVQRGQFENVIAVYHGSHGMDILTRNAEGSTAPIGTAWPVGSVVGKTLSFLGGANPPTVTNYQGGVVNQGGPGYSYLCVNGTPLECGQVIIGNIPDEKLSFTSAENNAYGQPGCGPGDLSVLGGEFGGTDGDPLLGAGAFKFSGCGGFLEMNGDRIYGNSFGQTSAVLKGNMQGQPGIYSAPGLDGSLPSAYYHDLNNGTLLDLSNGTFINLIHGRGQDANVGAPGSSESNTGFQYSKQFSFSDMAAGHALNRVTFLGSLNNVPGYSGDAGLLAETWDAGSHAWKQSWLLDAAGLHTRGVNVEPMLRGSITLTSAGSDSLVLSGLTTSSVCSFSPSNSVATKSNILPWYSVSTNSFTLNHAATVGAGAKYSVICSVH